MNRFIHFVLILLFAASSSLLANDLELVYERHADQPWLGVVVRTLDKSLRDQYQVRARYGALIEKILPDSPAQEAGLQEGDVAIKINNKTIRDADEFIDEIQRRQPGERLNILVWRKNEKKAVKVRLGEKPAPSLKKLPTPSRFALYSLGLQVEELDEDLADLFNLDPGDGVLVKRVLEDSPAEEAGLQAGDVITRINGQRVSDVNDFYEALQDAEEDEPVDIDFIRDDRRQKATLTLEPDYFDGQFRNWPGFNGPFDRNLDEDRLRRFYRLHPFMTPEGDGGNEMQELMDEVEKVRKELQELREEMRELRKELDEMRSK